MIGRIDMTNDLKVEELLKLQTTAYRLEAKLIGFDEIPPLADTADSLKRCGDTFYGYTAESGELAGAVAVEEERPGELTLTRMMVEPRFFRRGIARELIRYIFAHYPEFRRYIVSTGTRNEPAMRLYTGCGFVPFKTEQIAPGIELTTLKRDKENGKERMQ
ncbi:GNAT family N-acetyltransferase [Saccharibacillus sp. CPCC 101409]|uniref:GNAT family N-acetyltransferase n=1 Tax=Saccharibacillus sp. CPCC 101409 TaxID=3058041 RepID=UPI0026713754|nr:GNAT family N-acetyltransferase [Saccharibacillus sp. CPCC 101409]MDO3412806.1 GNAT family N-acetyltransferase [Saccharibacillus sp. CPCC 101409]